MISKKVYVVGSTNQDIVVQLKKRPALGETVFGDTLSYFQGGKGANQAVACHKAGAPTIFVSTIGTDAFGRSLKEQLEKIGLSCRLTCSPADPTGTAIIDVVGNGDNSITVIPGANRTLGFEEIKKATDDAAAGDILLIQNELAPGMIGKLVRLGKEKRMVTVVNVAPAVEITEDLPFIDYLILNEHEIEITLKETPLLLGSIDKAIETVQTLSDKVRTNLIVTIGEKGVIACAEGTSFHIKGHKVDVVDTTGAGDCFCGVFAACLAKVLPIADAVTYANAGAAFSVKALGASTSYPTVGEIESMLRDKGK